MVKLTIDARNGGKDNVYVQKLMFNGKNHDKNWVGHHALLQGGSLVFDMGVVPNKKRGVDNSSVPYSMTSELQETKKVKMMKRMKVVLLGMLVLICLNSSAQNWEHARDDAQVAVEVDTMHKKRVYLNLDQQGEGF